MRKQVVRFFFSFALVILVFLVIQASIFLFSVHQHRQEWITSVFDEYLDSFITSLKRELADTSKETFTVEQVLLTSLNDRISGLYLRNPDGQAVAAWGATATGDTLPLPLGRRSRVTRLIEGQIIPLAMGDKESGFTSKMMRCDLYEVSISKSGLLHTIEVSKRRKPLWQMIALPPEVKATDIAGSLTITYNDQSLGSVDVLTFTPDTYQGTTKLFGGMLSSFLISLPVALILSLLMAATLSRRSQRYTDSIQEALGSLAKGETQVILPKTNIDGQRVINEAIEQLGRNLEANQQSRQTWLRAISHDLNTPVTSMKLLIDGMADGVFPTDANQILTLQHEHETLAQKVAAVSLYATLQSPDAQAHQEPLDIPTYIDKVMEPFSEEQRERIYIDDQGSDLVGDPLLLVKAAQALLNNALTASNDSVGWKIRANELVFTNTGELEGGIDFFEPWIRGDQSRHNPGTGLGLPIVGQIMRLHGGDASITAEVGSVVVTLKW